MKLLCVEKRIFKLNYNKVPIYPSNSDLSPIPGKLKLIVYGTSFHFDHYYNLIFVEDLLCARTQ